MKFVAINITRRCNVHIEVTMSLSEYLTKKIYPTIHTSVQYRRYIFEVYNSVKLQCYLFALYFAEQIFIKTTNPGST